MIKYFWSRQPGKFVDKTNGNVGTAGSFTGTVREWYETLIEVMIDVGLSAANELREHPLRYLSWRGDANMCNVVECSVLYKPLDSNRELGMVGGGSDGLICNIPIKTDARLFNTGRLELYQFYGSSAERQVGEIQVIDKKIL